MDKEPAAVVVAQTAYYSKDRRVATLAELRHWLPRLTIVCEDGDLLDGHRMAVSVWPPVTSLVRRAGFSRAASALNAMLYFPSPRIRYARAFWRRVEPAVHETLTAGDTVTIITIAPPHDLGVLGLWLKRKYPSARWVVDWGDLWTYDEYYANAIPRRLLADVKRLEQQIFDVSDMNVVTNPKAREVVMRRHGVPPERVVSIPHAVNPVDRDGQPWDIQPTRSGGSHLIGVLGGIFKEPKVPGEQVIATLKTARTLGADLGLRLIGDPAAPFRPSTAEEWIEVLPRTSYAAAMRAAGECDVLLLALADLPNTKVIMHTKLADYLALAKPVVALVPPDSYAAELVRRAGAGVVLPLGPRCAESLVTHLRALLPGTVRRCEDLIEPLRSRAVVQKWLRAIAPGHLWHEKPASEHETSN